MNKIKIPTIIATLSAIIFFLEINSIFRIGEIINKYFPCKQNPMNSFPCQFVYDMYFILLLIGIFLTSLIIIGFKLYKTKKSQHHLKITNKIKIIKIIGLIIVSIATLIAIAFGTTIYLGAEQAKFLNEEHTLQENIDFCNKRKIFNDDCLLQIVMFPILKQKSKDLSSDYKIVCSSISDTGKKKYLFSVSC